MNLNNKLFFAVIGQIVNFDGAVPQEITVDYLILIAKIFGMSVDDVIFFDEKNGVPYEVSMNDKAALEQLQLFMN